MGNLDFFILLMQEQKYYLSVMSQGCAKCPRKAGMTTSWGFEGQVGELTSVREMIKYHVSNTETSCYTGLELLGFRTPQYPDGAQETLTQSSWP